MPFDAVCVYSKAKQHHGLLPVAHVFIVLEKAIHIYSHNLLYRLLMKFPHLLLYVIGATELG
jgi:hypothetical protein